MEKIDQCRKWKHEFNQTVKALKAANTSLEKQNPQARLLKPSEQVVVECILFMDNVSQIKDQIDANQKPDNKLTSDNKTIYASIFEAIENVEAIINEFTKDDELLGSETAIPPLIKKIRKDLNSFFVMCEDIVNFIG